ncbi:glycosyltransferase family 39 protein [Tundrisphaera sp. TA3]|uniref:ArnT family glycosyltransferase n=1 Tax=Tundrisphaera sp. TA3 TaxID=3435775 RepID=UPI003EBD659A
MTGRRWAIGMAVAAATLALMVATEPKMAIVWDEGFVLGRQARIRSWLRALADPPGFARTWTPPAPGSELVQQDIPPRPAPRADEIDTRGKLLSRPALDWFWPFAREEPHGHPPFYAIEGLIGDVLTPGRPDLQRARLGPMLAFSVAAGVLWWFAARRWGGWGASLAAGAWALQPNLFGHGHYATVDALLTSLWLLALVAFAEAVDTDRRSPRWGWAILFGMICGMAADSKLTGWFLPLPFLAWSVLYRDRRGLLALLAGGVAGALTLYAFGPPFWGDLVGGLERFFRSNLTRGRTIPIPVQFLGRIYDTPRESLPWYNTVAWTALVTPVGFLGLSLAGAARALASFGKRTGPVDERARRIERVGVLAVMHWGFLLALRAMPHTPGHDGVRLFLPAFGMLAIAAGSGAAWAVERWGRAGKVLVALALAEGAVAVAVMMPVPLSYFSPIAGGLPGAARLGMEPTYFWDGLTDDALDWINANTPPGRTVRFATFPTSWLYLKQSGKLTAALAPIDPGRPMWLVIQNRPGALGPVERNLLTRGTPAYVVRKLGVPLVLIYPYPDGT